MTAAVGDRLLLNEAVAHHRAGRLAEADMGYREIIRRAACDARANPDPGVLVRVYYNYSLLLTGMGRAEEAERACREALRLHPGFAPAWHDLGNLLAGWGRDGEAEAAWREAIRLAPAFEEPRINLINLLHGGGRLAEAEAFCRETLLLWPDHARLHCDLGGILHDLRRFDAAEAAWREALRLCPEYARAHCNLGRLLHEERRLPCEAEAAYREALRLQPDLPEAWHNLGQLLCDQNRVAEAEAAWQEALRLRPGYADAAWNLGLLLLRSGRLAEGWPLYEYRHHPQRKDPLPLPSGLAFPRWRGEALTGRSLLVIGEQGYGDDIQFCRCVPLLVERGACRITLAVKPPLVSLLATLAGVDRWIDTLDDVPWHDYWTPLMSLPGHLGVTLETIPARIPYLHPLPERVARWREILPAGGVRVGLVWRGSVLHANHANRSLPSLGVLAPLWALPGVVFVSLQVGDGEEEASAPPAGQPLFHAGAMIRDFADTAAIVAQLDLVIGVDTSVMHLCGALGKPGWVLLPEEGSDWRWLSGRDDSPWYPGVLRLFRQNRPGGWPEVVERVALALGMECVISRRAQGRITDAEGMARVLVSRFPRAGLGWKALATLLQDQNRMAEMLTVLEESLAWVADDAEIHNYLGLLRNEANRLEEAERALLTAIRLRPDYPDPWLNLGNLLHDRRCMARAEAAYRQALRLRPDWPEANSYLGLLLLSLGRFEEGWARYEYRYHPAHRKRQTPLPDLPFPQWEGEDLWGKSLLVIAEQGFGDTIQFCRYLPLLKFAGVTRLTLVCPLPLHPLMATLSGVDAQCADFSAAGEHDFWIHLLSLPGRHATTLANLPARIPYLGALPDRLARWRARLPEGGIRVGLVWKGSSSHFNNQNRSLPSLATLAPLWSVPGVVFVGLQKGEGEEEALAPPAGQPLSHLGGEIRDFADTAAIVAQLDLVIGVDTAVVHLCGALAKPCWVLLPALGTDWRWMFDREDSPWYPGVARLFRQEVGEGWLEVVVRVTGALAGLAASRENHRH
ncbi:MAG: tetratricopeptide repeat protein [Magnetococcales bacterium]|nr:tetratricopeptide repeat protein [Magnetococcales bacterium]